MVVKKFEDFWLSTRRYRLESRYNFKDLKENYSCANGCGAKGGINVPDTMYGVDISDACNIHDIEWQLARSYYDLIEANHRFRRNIERIIDFESANSFMVWLRMMRLHKYYDAVKLLGTPAYMKERGFEKH